MIQMLKIKPSTQFKKDLKKFKHNLKVIHELDSVIQILVQRKVLPAKYQDHSLTGNWKGFRDCHVKPDALLIYRLVEQDQLLVLERFGSHAELFV